MAMAGAQRRRLQRLHAQVSAGAAAAGPPSDPSTLRDPTRDRPVPDPLEPVPLLRADGESDTDPLLSPEQIQQFKTDGFVLKRWGGVQYTRNELTRLQDYMWEHFPDGIRRDDPATWLDPYELPSWQSEVRERGDDTDYVTATATGTGWKWHQGGVEPWIRGMLHSNDWITGVVEQMVGGPLREAERARGIYNLFPTSNLDGCKKKTPPPFVAMPARCVQTDHLPRQARDKRAETSHDEDHTVCFRAGPVGSGRTTTPATLRSSS